MIEYTVVKKNGLEDMIASVNTLAQQGWIPIGGVVAVPATWFYCQAMMRTVEVPPTP